MVFRLTKKIVWSERLLIIGYDDDDGYEDDGYDGYSPRAISTGTWSC